MSLREKINEQFNNALKAKNRTLISTLRLILSAIKERDIANRTAEKKAWFVGVAYSGQAVDKVPIASTDEPMDGILTPSGLILR